MTTRKLRVLCDVDGVLADFVGLVLDYIARNTGLTPRREALDQWDCFAAVNMGDHWPYFREQCDALGLCRSMREMPGARELWAELTRSDGAAGQGAYDTKVCTTPMTVAWLSQRAAWLEEFGVPLARQIQMHGKEDLAQNARALVEGAWRPSRGYGGYDALIDDKVENCIDFMRAGGFAFCITAAYNTHAPYHLARGSHVECIAWLRDLRAELL